MYQKFIINEGRLIAGWVDQHRELAQDHSTTFYYSHADKRENAMLKDERLG